MDLSNQENLEKLTYIMQYFGQKVLKSYSSPMIIDLDILKRSMLSYIVLELKSIADITEGDLSIINSMEHTNYQYSDSNDFLIHIHSMNLAQSQYLISQGYALPFRNHDIDELIEKRWLVIKRT